MQQEDTLLGEEERAAAKIQAGYRGFQTRRKMQEKKAEQEWETRRREEEERAATKIQAGYRGFSSRKNTANSLMAELQPSEPVRADSPPPTYNDRQDQRTPPREDSYDSLDREISAATKIQSSFRGYQARKEYGRNREAAVILSDDNVNDDNSHTKRVTSAPSSPPRALSPRENESESGGKSPAAPSNPPARSPTPPLVSNERAVDRYRSSFSEIQNAPIASGNEIDKAYSPRGSPLQANSDRQSSTPERDEGRREEMASRGRPDQEGEPGQKSSDTPQPADGARRSPSSQLGQVKAQEGQASPEPGQREVHSQPEEEVRDLRTNGEEAAEAAEPEDHGRGKQNGHDRPVEGPGVHDSDVTS